MKFMRLLSITLMRRLSVNELRDPVTIIVVFLLSVLFPAYPLLETVWLIVDNAFGKEFSDELLAARADDEYENRLT